MRLSEITSQTHLDLYVLLSYSSVFLPPPKKKKACALCSFICRFHYLIIFLNLFILSHFPLITKN